VSLNSERDSLPGRLVALTAADPRAVALIGPDGERVSRAELVGGTRPRAGGEVAVALRPLLALQRGGSCQLRLATSGSTGRPRVVRRSVASWAASLTALDALTGLQAGHLVWAPGPASSTMTLYAAVQALAAGATVLASGPWRGVPGPAGDLAREATLLHAVPVVFEAILDALARDASHGLRWRLRTAVVAGGPSRPDLRRHCAGHGIRLVEYYGSAELSFVAVDDDGTGLRPFPGVEVSLRDGVLWARSPYLADSVDEVPVRDDDGWATAGDRAVWTRRPPGPDTGDASAGRGRDDRPRLRLLGRAGSAQVAGHTVCLADVEAALCAVSGVREAVCLAVPDPVLGQRILAVIEPEAGADPLPALRAAEGLLPAPSRPGRHRVLGTLPRTPSGKVDRPALEELWATGTSR